ncbi:MAG: PQQ-dependent sugar dehydrogenase [Actinobacteria bacterium]|nr:PQQ-dependent sugar dehydrogenase [Actinomycetota bacterium]
MSRTLAALAACAVLAGCTAPEAPSPTPGTTSVPPASTPATGPTVLATNLDVPWDVAVLPDGGVLVTLRDEAMLVRVADGTVRARTVVPGVVPGGEGGLLGLALSPSFADDGLLYLYLTAADDNRVVRFRYTGGELLEPLPILTGIPKAGNHNGGRLRFGPDGALYLGTGDAGSPGLAQDRSSLAGKILRIGADGSIPADNPFGNAVYSYGHRNVQGLGWDAEGRLYASEFGQNTFDELNLIRPGGNYGWPQAEGRSSAEGLVSPALVWRTSEASPSGIAVTPEGTVYLAALRGERVWRTRRDGDAMAAPEVVLDGLGRVRAVEVVGGQLYVLTNNTARGTPRSGDDRLLAVPLP